MWIFQGKEIKSFQDIPEEYKDSYGFVYIIVASNGKEYIGRKQLLSRRKKYLSQKAIKQRGTKGIPYVIDKKKRKRKYYEMEVKETDWINYTGSNKQLNEDIKKNGVTVTKFITCFCKTKTQLTYAEVKEQFCSGVIEEDKFYNDNILGRFFGKDVKDDQRGVQENSEEG